MEQGADDFIIKDRLSRLGPPVARALEQQRLREEIRRAQEALQRHEELSRRILASAQELKRLTPLYEKVALLAHNLVVTQEQTAAVEAADAPLRE